ncbi:MAG: transposase [Clostridia bacterium]|nr:transposase [Clostridia bacterium]
MIDFPQRKQLRLKEYDYSLPGTYFVTICAIERLSLFGEIVETGGNINQRRIQPSEIGKIVSECWNNININTDCVKTDAFCLMPNHIHGIIQIYEAGGQRRPPLQKIIQGFKSVSTRRCFKYDCKNIWQRGYYEHIINSDHELQNVRQYIIHNANNWREDQYFAS